MYLLATLDNKIILLSIIVWFLFAAINFFVVCVYAMSKTRRLNDKEIVQCTFCVLGGPLTIIGVLLYGCCEVIAAFYRVITKQSRN